MRPILALTALLLALTACNETKSAMYPNAAAKCDSLNLDINSAEYTDCINKFKGSEAELRDSNRI